MLDRILVPLDGSDRAESVLEQLRPLLHRRDSEVILVRAVEFPTSLRTYDPRLLAAERSDVAGYLAAVEKRLAGRGVRGRSITTEGLPAEAILAVAKEQRATLIAMMTHGRSGIARFVLGSMTEKIVRASDVPVLVMRSFAPGGSAEKAVERAFRKILVPMDGSEASLQVLSPVIELTKLYGATVEIAYIDEGVVYPPGAFAGSLGMAPVSGVRVPDEASPETLLRPALERLAKASVPAVMLTSGGDAAAQILDLAKTSGADLIAMATHGRSGLSRWMLGSVTEKVLRAASLPMLIVRARLTQA